MPDGRVVLSALLLLFFACYYAIVSLVYWAKPLPRLCLFLLSLFFSTHAVEPSVYRFL